jgi:hypothetical protein
MDNKLDKNDFRTKEGCGKEPVFIGNWRGIHCDASRFRDSRSNIHTERTWRIQIGGRRGSWI